MDMGAGTWRGVWEKAGTKTEGREKRILGWAQLFWTVARQRDKKPWCGVCHKFLARTWKEGKINPGGGGGEDLGEVG